MKPDGSGAAVESHVSQIPISGCVEPDISDDFGIQEDNELQSKLSAPAADAVMTKPPAAESGKKNVKSDKDELAKEVEKVSEQIAANDAENAIQQKPYIFPTVDLLKAPDRGKTGDSQAHLRETAAKLEQTLNVFGVNAKVNNISCGPAVTRFEITPELGVKVSKIVNLADDIKLNLAAADIRIEAPIPGKAAVGIEVPNSQSVAVSFRELVESEEFKNAKSKITFAVGKDIAGKVKVTDIAKMPHLLIAGATGSGKSVCINTIIMSILYKAKPDEVKLIMIDPKVVELSVYNGIPHLMIPVVTDPKKAAGALNWAVSEMTDRYEKFANSGVREINGYNAMIDAMDGKDTEKPPKMPQIVIIVDELADLMMVASKDVEEAICRLAQLARAAGIHLIIATQRPSVNVITGLIKANMPSRIAFAVTSSSEIFALYFP
jgi:DNA segregation ATPase FtsK/SpoIIIE, S-DNA-T family